MNMQEGIDFNFDYGLDEDTAVIHLQYYPFIELIVSFKIEDETDTPIAIIANGKGEKFEFKMEKKLNKKFFKAVIKKKALTIFVLDDEMEVYEPKVLNIGNVFKVAVRCK